MRIVAFIPARGGSKGVRRKNLRSIGPFSLLSLKIAQAKKSKCDEIYVSTEDDEIAKVAKLSGAEVISRPMELAQDDTSTDAVLLHAIQAIGLKESDYLVLLQATSPFLESSKINECIDSLLNSQGDSSAITIRYGHPFMWKQVGAQIDPSGHTRNKRPRRQDLGVEGWETGGCYAILVGALMKQGVRYPAPTLGVGVNQLEALDIDTVDDLEMAQEIFETLAISKKLKDISGD